MVCDSCYVKIVTLGNFIVIHKVVGGVMTECRVISRMDIWLPDCWGDLIGGSGVSADAISSCRNVVGNGVSVPVADCFRVQVVCCGKLSTVVNLMPTTCKFVYGSEELSFATTSEFCSWFVNTFSCVPCPIAPMPGDTYRDAVLVAASGASSVTVGMYEWSAEVKLNSAFYSGEGLVFDLSGIPVAGDWSLTVVSPSYPATLPILVNGSSDGVDFGGYLPAGTSFIVSGQFGNVGSVSGTLTFAIVSGDTDTAGNSISGSY